MLKKAFLLASIACLGFADIAYSQNNPPSQHKITGYVAKDHPILFNANLLVGEISGTPVNYLQTIHTPPFGPSNTFNFTRFDFPNKIDVGFRFGLGIGLSNSVNASVQWTWFHTKVAKEKRFAAPVGGNLLIQIPIFPADTDDVTIDNEKAIATAEQKMRYQTLDFLVQTASWMIGSHIRFQPLGGVRLFYFKRELMATLINLDEDERATITNHFKLRGSGVLIGADIKYIFSKRFFFFSNLMAGILGGYETRDLNAFTDFNTTQTFKFHERFNLSFDPMVEVRLGFAFDTLINKQWLLSLYVAYEFSSMIHTSAKPLIPPTDPATFDDVDIPIRTNDVIKTQFGVLGAMVAF